MNHSNSNDSSTHLAGMDELLQGIDLNKLQRTLFGGQPLDAKSGGLSGMLDNAGQKVGQPFGIGMNPSKLPGIGMDFGKDYGLSGGLGNAGRYAVPPPGIGMNLGKTPGFGMGVGKPGGIGGGLGGAPDSIGALGSRIDLFKEMSNNLEDVTAEAVRQAKITGMIPK